MTDQILDLKEKVKMRKKIISLLLIFIFLFNSSISVQNAIPDTKKNFLWKVQSKTNTLYILGSIHFLKKVFALLHDVVGQIQRFGNVIDINCQLHGNSFTKILKKAYMAQ